MSHRNPVGHFCLLLFDLVKFLEFVFEVFDVVISREFLSGGELQQFIISVKSAILLDLFLQSFLYFRILSFFKQGIDIHLFFHFVDELSADGTAQGISREVTERSL